MSETLPEPDSARLRALSTARVGLGRTGVSQIARDLLAFQKAHATARDAVHARLDSASLAMAIANSICPEVLRLHSAAASRTQYLQRPDLGRTLNETSRALLARQPKPVDVSLVIADGLSALAVERHVPALICALLPRLSRRLLGPIVIVEQGRVAIADEVGELLEAQVAVILIGERPGLTAPDSLGAYITWMPRRDRTDAERVCISNIRAEGLSYAEAATKIESAIESAFRCRMTGVGTQRFLESGLENPA